jgi:hypothetical protein
VEVEAGASAPVLEPPEAGSAVVASAEGSVVLGSEQAVALASALVVVRESVEVAVWGRLVLALGVLALAVASAVV